VTEFQKEQGFELGTLTEIGDKH